jgi:hypothetical protein
MLATRSPGSTGAGSHVADVVERLDVANVNAYSEHD